MFISSKVNESYVYMYMSLSFYCILFFTSEKALVRRIDFDFDLHNYNERKPVNFTVPKMSNVSSNCKESELED